jgi:hypothetical protein
MANGGLSEDRAWSSRSRDVKVAGDVSITATVCAVMWAFGHPGPGGTVGVWVAGGLLLVWLFVSSLARKLAKVPTRLPIRIIFTAIALGGLVYIEPTVRDPGKPVLVRPPERAWIRSFPNPPPGFPEYTSD